MIERHVTFEVLPEHEIDFERLFVDEYRPAMSSMPGFEKVELLRDTEHPSQYQMVIRFDTPENAATWRASEAHKAIQPRIKALYSGSNLSVYDVVA
jgi:heme-degrading monooxygenase HmoA